MNRKPRPSDLRPGRLLRGLLAATALYLPLAAPGCADDQLGPPAPGGDNACAGGDAASEPPHRSCGNGLDDDGDGRTDGADPDCATPMDDEVLGGRACHDECVHGYAHPDGDRLRCGLWEAERQAWGALDVTRLHDRSRAYLAWLRRYNHPAGAVSDTLFTDASLGAIRRYAGTGDSAIWTGTYLAGEALRALAGDPEAAAEVASVVAVLHRWFNISGDAGYLARFAAPMDSEPAIQAVMAPDQRHHHLDVPFEGGLWYWEGHISRDQYQGVMLGYSWAYDATTDEVVREPIRADVVALVEQLMREDQKNLNFTLRDSAWPFPVPIAVSVRMPYAVFTDDETPDGRPSLDLDLDDFERSNIWGFQEFMPDVSVLLNQIGALTALVGTLPPIPRAGSAIMLASFFRVALQVTAGVPAYAQRRAAIAAFYEAHIDAWLDLAAQYREFKVCGQSYYSLNIVMEPLWNLARLEDDPARAWRVREQVLRQALWAEVADHKNVFFALIYAAHAPYSGVVPGVVGPHLFQLRQFSPPPRTRRAVDLTGLYPPDPDCPGKSLVATEVADRVTSDFIWQRDPWSLVDPGIPELVQPGVDLLLPYWMARHYGWLDDDTPGACLRWGPAGG